MRTGPVLGSGVGLVGAVHHFVTNGVPKAEPASETKKWLTLHGHYFRRRTLEIATLLTLLAGASSSSLLSEMHSGTGGGGGGGGCDGRWLARGGTAKDIAQLREPTTGVNDQGISVEKWGGTLDIGGGLGTW